MSIVEINWSPTHRQLKQFGWLCLGVLPLLGWLWGARATQMEILFGVACVIAVLSYLQPRIVRPVFVGLMLVAAPIGMVVGELAMLFIYFVIFLPIGLWFRVMRRDALQLKIDHEAESYWQTKAEPKDVARYYRRY